MHTVGISESRMLTNCNGSLDRTSILLVLPLLQSLSQQNKVSYKMVDLLQAHNLAAPSGSDEDCAYLRSSVESWVHMAAKAQPASLFEVEDTYILWAQILPVRCDFQRDDGVITFCDDQAEVSLHSATPGTCMVWDDHGPASPDDASPDYFAEQFSLRVEGIRKISQETVLRNLSRYETNVIYNDNPTVALV